MSSAPEASAGALAPEPPAPGAPGAQPAPGVVVLDTNAVLDWLVFDDPRIGALGAAIAARRLTWLATDRMRAELCAVLQRPPFTLTPFICERALTAFDETAWLRPHPPPAPASLRCTDPDDQVFLDLAHAERAGWLVTRDKALLALRRRAAMQGLTIATPGEWPGGSPRESPREVAA